jgi:hypothetical protein
VSATFLSVRADHLPHASRYNGMLAELHRRFWQGAYWRVAYSLGKATDEHGAATTTDHRHRFVASTVYTTDIWADRVGGWLEPLLKDFTLGVIWEIQSGQPDAAVAEGDPLRLPAYATLDTRVARRIDLGDRRQLQLIWQAFNLRNRPNYLSFDEPTQADPRRMELAARFLF